jgi:conjugal transfer pilus assembly protein TraE
MEHLFKEHSVSQVIKYNKALLLICALLSISTTLLCFKVIFGEEKWILIPTSQPSKRIEISSKGYSQVYLREWAYYCLQVLMTTSQDTVEAQVEELKVISSNSESLKSFFAKHIDFVKGSSISSVFFPKSITFQDSSVIVSGLFRYWLGGNPEVISCEKTYLLSYKRGINDVLLLSGVKELEVKSTTNE